MVTIGLLTFIILGLLTMFMQTQKVFRSSMTQTDVLESGRSIMDMLSREIEQATPTRYPNYYIGGRPILATNFLVETTSDLNDLLWQELPGAVPPKVYRTNYLERLFFFTKVNQDWVGTGYVVVPDNATDRVGALYRFSVTNDSRTGPFVNASALFRVVSYTNMSRIADGIVHFRARTFDANGFPFVGVPAYTNAFVRTNAVLPIAGSGIFPFARVPEVGTVVDTRAPDQMAACYFAHNAVPAYVELELGILEPQLLQRYKGIPVVGAPAGQQEPRRQFLSDRVAQVHIFRQRIPIRNVDVSVFP